MSSPSHNDIVQSIRRVILKADALVCRLTWNEFLTFAGADGSLPICDITRDMYSIFHDFARERLSREAFLLGLAALICDEPE